MVKLVLKGKKVFFFFFLFCITDDAANLKVCVMVYTRNMAAFTEGNHWLLLQLN